MFLRAFFLLSLMMAPTFVYAADVETAAKQAIVVDYDTGMVLFEKNADEQMPTSSMSKVMTMYMVFDALKSGSLKLDDTLLVSEKAWRKGGSKMFVKVNTRIKVEDLIRGVIIQSGNDATIVLAEGLAGSEDAFAAGMTKKAKEIGMSESNFMNASGWPDPDHYSTARDLATLGISIVKEFPDYYKYYSEKEYTYSEITQKNRNPLLFRDMGADGIKTGHTEAGGYGLIGSGVHKDRRVVMVVNGLESESARAQEGAKLLEWGLRGFENKTVIKAGQKIADAAVVYGAQASVPLTIRKDVLVTVKKVSGDDIKVSVSYNGPVAAPIQKGQDIGTVSIQVPESDIVVKVPAIAAEDVAAQWIFFRTISKAKQFFAG